MHGKVKVAGRVAGVALAAQAQLAAVADAGRDIDLQAGSRTAGRKRDLLGAAPAGFLEGDLDLGFDVGTAARTPAAEHTAEGVAPGLPAKTAVAGHAAEKRFEKVAVHSAAAEVLAVEIEVEILEARAAGELLAMLPVRAELVVHTALLVVLQDFVGLVYLLEPVLGGLVAGVEVRMIFAGKLLVGLRYLIFASRTLNAQQFVIILVFYSHFLSPEQRYPPYRY